MNRLEEYLYNLAMKSSLRRWALSLTGWKWWFWQLGVGGVFIVLVEYLLNLIGMTLIHWG